MSAEVWVITRNRVITQTWDPAPWSAIVPSHADTHIGSELEELIRLSLRDLHSQLGWPELTASADHHGGSEQAATADDRSQLGDGRSLEGCWAGRRALVCTPTTSSASRGPLDIEPSRARGGAHLGAIRCR